MIKKRPIKNNQHSNLVKQDPTYSKKLNPNKNKFIYKIQKLNPKLHNIIPNNKTKNLLISYSIYKKEKYYISR